MTPGAEQEVNLTVFGFQYEKTSAFKKNKLHAYSILYANSIGDRG